MPKSKIVPPQIKNRRVVAVSQTVGAEDTTSYQLPVVSKTRADFRAEEFVRLIRQKGYFCLWRKAMLCTCYEKRTGQMNMNCEFCNGSGYKYVDPHEIQCILTGMNRKVDVYNHAGQMVSGTASATTEPQYRLGFRDSLELRDSVMVMNELIEKGLRRGSRRLLPIDVDAARYKIIKVVALVVGQARLEENIHYKVREGLIEWTALGHAAAPTGTMISLHYEYHPVLIVTSHANMIRDTLTLFKKPGGATAESLPLKVEVQLEFLAVSGDDPALPATGPHVVGPPECCG